jgi:methyl-accepting chemotaxis protein
MQRFFSKLNLKMRLLSFILFISLISIVFVAAISYQKSKSALTELSINQLSSQGSLLKKSLSGYFQRTISTTKTLSVNRLIEGLFVAYESSFYGSGFDPGKDEQIYNDFYTKLDSQYEKRKLAMLKEFQISDFFLVTTSAQVVFTAQNKKHKNFLGKNLASGSYSKTPLGKCFTKADKGADGKVFFSDFFANVATKTTDAFFCIKKLAEFDNQDEGVSKGDKIGVLIIKIDTDLVNKILGERVGMGETGQAYIVGDDLKLRSNFRLNTEKYNTFNSLSNDVMVDTSSVKLAQEGSEGSHFITDALGSDVISFYSPIEISGRKWAMVTEKTTKEVFTPITSMITITIISSIVIFILITFATLYMLNLIVNPIVESNNNLKVISDGLSSGSSDLQENSDTLNKGAENLSSSITETVASMNELTSMVNQTLQNVKDSSKSSNDMMKRAKEGKEAIIEVEQAVGEISLNNDNVVETMSLVIEHMENFKKVVIEISDKTKVINDIVFQTKLLSFNASVEAARAGEQGKGFSVVAEEVGNLATASGKAAEEIAHLLDENIKKVDDIVTDTSNKVNQIKETGAQKISVGNETASKCKEVFEQISTIVLDVSQKIAEIDTASNEQAVGIKEVNNAMNSLREVTDQTSYIASKNTQSAENLSGESTRLKGIFDMLNQLVKGSEGSKAELIEHVSEPVKESNVVALDTENTKLKAGEVPDENDSRFVDL